MWGGAKQHCIPPVLTCLQTENCLQQRLSRQCSTKSPSEKKTKEGAVRKSLTIFCLPVKSLANVQNPCLPCSIHSKWTGGSVVDLSRAVQKKKLKYSTKPINPHLIRLRCCPEFRNLH